MPTKAQNELARKMNLLAELSDDTPTTETMHFEGTSWRVPARYEHDLDGAANDFISMVRSYEEPITVNRTYEFRPSDGAYATWRMLIDFFGYAQGVRDGRNPPAEISIPIGWVGGILEHVTVPWGKMVLPLENATLNIASTYNDQGMEVFYLAIQGKKKYRPYFIGFFNAVEAYLQAHSIYAGKALNGRFEFIDTEKIDPSKFVYTERVWTQAGTAIFSPLRDYEVLEAAGLSRRRAVILEGSYGGGKTGLLYGAAKQAHANGWMSFLCEPGVDDPLAVLRQAFQYAEHGHRIFFACEDIDTFSKHGDDQWNTRLLDLYDSGLRKGYQIVMVATTNHITDIQKGMMRSGRIDAVIEIGPMDRPGVEKLCRIVLRDNLEDDIDFDAVYAATEGYMPAFVREGIERALRYVIAETRAVGKITTHALVSAMDSLREQHDHFTNATDRKAELPALDQAFRDVVARETAQVVEAQPWVNYAEQAIDNNDLPSAGRISDLVDERIESRLNGAQLIRESNGESYASIETN